MQINNNLPALSGIKYSAVDLLKLVGSSKIKAEIISLENNELTLKLPDGQVIKGKPDQNATGFKLNEVLDFNVRLVNNKIIFSPAKSEKSMTQPLQDPVRDFLNDANLAPTEKNAKAVNTLIENNLQVSKENVLKLNQNLSLTDNVDQAVFLLKNKIAPTKNNAQILKDLVNHENSIGNQIDDIFGLVEKLSDPEIKSQLIDILNTNENSTNDEEILITKEFLKTNEASEPDAPKNVRSKEIATEDKKIIQSSIQENKENNKEEIKKPAFDFINSTPEDLDEFLENLKEKAIQAKQCLAKPQTEEAETLQKSFTKLKDNIDFFVNTKENIFLQIPLLIEDKKLNSEIYVFDEKKTKKINPSDCSALVTLDTAHLGRFETFIKKNNNQLNFEFRLENTEIEELVKQNIINLESALAQKGYSFSGFGFKTNDDFDITQNTNEHVSQFISFDFRA